MNAKNFVLREITPNVVEKTYEAWKAVGYDDDEFSIEYEGFFELLRNHAKNPDAGVYKTVYYGIFKSESDTVAAAFVETVDATVSQAKGYTKILDFYPNPAYANIAMLNELLDVYVYTLGSVMSTCLSDGKNFVKIYNRNPDFDMILQAIQQRFSGSEAPSTVDGAYFEGRKWLKIEFRKPKSVTLTQ